MVGLAQAGTESPAAAAGEEVEAEAEARVLALVSG